MYSFNRVGESRSNEPWRIGDDVEKFADVSHRPSTAFAECWRYIFIALALVAMPAAAALPVESSAPSALPVAPPAATLAPPPPAFPGHEVAAPADPATDRSGSGFEIPVVPDIAASAGNPGSSAVKSGWNPKRLRFRDAVAAALVDPVSLQIVFSGIALIFAVAYLRRRRRRRLAWGVMPDRSPLRHDHEHSEP